MYEVIIVLSVDDEIEHWLEVSFTDSDEVKVDHVPGLEHDWNVFWVKPHLILFGHVEGLDSSFDELSLVLYDNLVLVLVGDLGPVLLDGTELVGVADTGDLASEGDDLSELVVLLVEDNPLIVVDVDVESLVWVGTGHM